MVVSVSLFNKELIWLQSTAWSSNIRTSFLAVMVGDGNDAEVVSSFLSSIKLPFQIILRGATPWES